MKHAGRTLQHTVFATLVTPTLATRSNTGSQGSLATRVGDKRLLAHVQAAAHVCSLRQPSPGDNMYS